MNNCKKTIKQSDISITPIKLKYAATYFRDGSDVEQVNNITEYYFRGYRDIMIYYAGNIPKNDIKYPKFAYNFDRYIGIRYMLLKQLYYQNYLTGSLENSSSLWNWNQQSSAYSGSAEYEYRYIPNGPAKSYVNTPEILTYIYVSPKYAGEQISRNTFCLQPETGNQYKIVDDGNGNLIDIENSNKKIGNIIYSQGMIIITNPDYIQIIIEP
jgi:hypothetical protein